MTPARIGVMGGSFDPIHNGHLRAAENARAELRLDRVLFVPAGRSPLKDGPTAEAFDRHAMVALAVADHPAFSVCDLELRREGPSYTVDTVSSLREQYPGDELLLILGSDAFAELGKWKDVARLRTLCGVAVVERPGHPTVAASEDVARVGGTGLAVAAREVRALLAAGHSVRYLVPPAVADYITKQGLYR
jgi:nicotinate-nucleotide adenylyltransferase